MGWLLACLLAMSLWRMRRRLKRLRQALPAAAASGDHALERDSASSVPLPYRYLHHLVVLSLELERLHTVGQLESARLADLQAQITHLWTDISGHLGTAPESEAWHQARETAWALLLEQSMRLESPPWAVVAPQTVSESIPALAPAPEVVASTPLAVPVEPLPPPVVPEPVAEVNSAEDITSYAWEPPPPSAVERALAAMAGWPAVLVPFLVQNIGWFVGGLCFVAGSIFLVTYTTGFAKTLTSFAALAVYTLLFLYAGYQLRRRRPALEVSSNALLILGVLLVPLNVTAAVRLLLAAGTAPGLLIVGLLATGVGIGGVYATAILVSGIMDRTLQRQHPRLFLALAAVQLGVPVLLHVPFWPLLLLCHAVLLALLAYGVVMFIPTWLPSIFLERRPLAYYAAGTLVYAALVSFVHLTWGTQEVMALPQGYYGPWLMLLSALLFYVDAQLKPWRQQAAWLSHLSFGLYGLSIIALLLALEAPIARLCALGLGVLLYGLVTWQYATLPPLYLLLGCVAWLYHGLLLQHVPWAWYGIGSLPGLAALWAANRWTARHQATVLALVGDRVLALATVGVATWSVLHAEPGWLALSTSLLVLGLTCSAARLFPTPLWSVPGVWTYAGAAAGVAAAAYTPPVLELAWAVQTAWGLLGLAAVWSGVGLRQQRRPDGAVASAALLNNALLTLVLCLGLVVWLCLTGVLVHPCHTAAAYRDWWHSTVAQSLAGGAMALLRSPGSLGCCWCPGETDLLPGTWQRDHQCECGVGPLDGAVVRRVQERPRAGIISGTAGIACGPGSSTHHTLGLSRALRCPAYGHAPAPAAGHGPALECERGTAWLAFLRRRHHHLGHCRASECASGRASYRDIAAGLAVADCPAPGMRRHHHYSGPQWWRLDWRGAQRHRGGLCPAGLASGRHAVAAPGRAAPGAGRAFARGSPAVGTVAACHGL